MKKGVITFLFIGLNTFYFGGSQYGSSAVTQSETGTVELSATGQEIIRVSVTGANGGGGGSWG